MNIYIYTNVVHVRRAQIRIWTAECRGTMVFATAAFATVCVNMFKGDSKGVRKGVCKGVRRYGCAGARNVCIKKYRRRQEKHAKARGYRRTHESTKIKFKIN